MSGLGEVSPAMTLHLASRLRPAFFSAMLGIGLAMGLPVHAAQTITPAVTFGAQPGFGSAVAMNDQFILIGSPAEGPLGTSNRGVVYVYTATTRKLVRILKGTMPVDGERFGYRVAVAGSTAYISAPGRATAFKDAGAVYAFDIPTGRRLWIHDNLAPNELLGNGGLAVVGEYVAVGAPYGTGPSNHPESGYVRVLDRRNGQIVGVISPQNATVGDHCGWSLAASGSLLAIGVRDADDVGSNRGKVLLADLLLPGFPFTTFYSPSGTYQFGSDVALHKGFLAIADSGSVIVYRVSDGTSVVGLAPSGATGEIHVALTGNRLFISDANLVGGGHVWSHDLAENMETIIVSPPAGNGSGDHFGKALAAFQDRLIVGDGVGKPRASVYELPETEWFTSKIRPVLSGIDFAPGTNNGVGSINPFTLSIIGRTAAIGNLVGPGITNANRQAVWNGLSMATGKLIVRAGDAWGAAKLSGFTSVLLNNSSRSLISAKLTGTNAKVLLEDQGASVVELVREGATINGGKQLARLFEVVQPDTYATSTDRASAAGSYKIGVTGVTSANDTAIFTTSTIATLGETAREGNASPIPSVAYGQILPRLSRTGSHIAFASMLTGVPAAANMAVFRNTVGGSTKLIARKGDIAPGAMGGKFSTFLGELAAFTGNVSFRATLTGVPASGNEGIWTTDSTGSNLQLVARKGNPAPYLPAGVVFSRFLRLHQTGTGGLVLWATVKGPGVNGGNDQVIYSFEAPTEGFRLIVREGDLAPDAGGARIGTLQNFDLANSETYQFTASLTQCSGGTNQAFFTGRKTTGISRASMQPQLQVRKGSHYLRMSSSLTVTGISFSRLADKAGLGSKGLGYTCAFQNHAFALQYADGTTDWMAGKP